MATSRAKPRYANIGDLLESLGGISPSRICYDPAPGRATEKDLVRLNERKGRLYELVENTLVEKEMGWLESSLAMWIGRLIGNFVAEHDLGEVGGADGASKLLQGLVRVPDVSFISKERLPGGHMPLAKVPEIAPDLAIEVLSESNTPGEMLRKRKEYFLAGTLLVWEIDPQERTVDVFTAPDRRTTLTEKDTLDGGTVLPGFSVPVAEVFARVPKAAPANPKKKK